MDITRWIKKNRTVIIDKDDIIIAEKLISLENSKQVLLKKKMRHCITLIVKKKKGDS